MIFYLQLQELKSYLIEIQTDFQLQVKTLKKELEDEKQARIKLEAEVTIICESLPILYSVLVQVRALKKLVNK